MEPEHTAHQRATASPRHCAFCLRLFPAENVKLCSKCRRRAYCSKDCQKMDWTTGGVGQGHKNWCAHGCGEEDLDWEVLPTNVEGKGLGVFAKRDIPPGYRLIVERGYMFDELIDSGPAHAIFDANLRELVPADGSAEDKYHVNALSVGPSNPDMSVLCFRISRINHSCDANAGHYYDETFKVKVLFTERTIHAGEEICINYTNKPADEARDILSTKWNIQCPPGCRCQNADIQRLMVKAQRLDERIFSLGAFGRIQEALACASELMALHDQLGASYAARMRTGYDAFQIAITQRTTLRQAQKYMQQAIDAAAIFLHPDNEQLLQWKSYARQPSLHRNYLIMGG